MSKSVSEDTPLSTAGSSATLKPTPAQDKLTADTDTLTKKIEWRKPALASGIDEIAEETRKKIKFLIDERESALKCKNRLQNEADQKKKARNQKPEETEGARTYGEKTGNRSRVVLSYYDQTNWTAYVRR